MGEPRKNGFRWLQAVFVDNFGLSPGLALVAAILLIFVVFGGIGWFFYAAPPDTLTITAGPKGSSFETNAVRFADKLAENGIKLRILESKGSQENLERLEDPSVRVGLGFVQSGSSNSLAGEHTNDIVSLGAISYEPLFIFYRGPERNILSQFKGQKLEIGPPGSGTRSLALTLLVLNGLSNAVTLVDLPLTQAQQALSDGSIDALFLMGDSASSQLVRDLLRDPNIKLFDFAQAEGYARKYSYLSKIVLPEGSIDFGKNIPSHDINLIGPTVDLIARKKLHPALSDLTLEAAQKIFGKPSLFRRQKEFPANVEHDIPISADAERFYTSGKTGTYRYLPFWLASLVNRCVVVVIPLFVVLIPGMKVIPALLRMRMKIRLFRWYRALMSVERELLNTPNGAERKDLAARLGRIEEEVNNTKVPATYADQFYVLRQNVIFVRNNLPKAKG